MRVAFTSSIRRTFGNAVELVWQAVDVPAGAPVRRGRVRACAVVINNAVTHVLAWHAKIAGKAQRHLPAVCKRCTAPQQRRNHCR